MRLRLNLDSYVSYLIGLAVSLGLFSVILLVFGYQPVPSLETIATGSFGTVFSASSTFVQTIPFLLCALAFLVPFKARFYNIGVEGQLYVGALIAFLAASQMGGIPAPLAIILTAGAGFLGGTLWVGLPLLLKLKLQVNEIFPTLVMNFVALDLVNWMTSGPLKDPKAVNPQTPVVPQTTWLPTIVPNTQLTVGFLIAILAAVAIYFVFQRTVLGYEIRASGANPLAASAGGVSVTRSIFLVGVLSGGLAGLGGMIIITTGNHYLVQNFSPGYGYQGIGVAALANFNPIGTIFSAVLYSALSIGGQNLQLLPGTESVPIQLIYVLQATIVLTVLLVQRVLSGRRRF
jgi:general nucleoside transport system permease protein